MIKGITSGGNNIVVSGGSSFMPYVNMSTPSAGMLRYNGTNQSLETYDGAGWLTIASNHATIELTGSANSAIAWAMTKMAEEAELQKLAQSHPAVRAAYDAFKRAGEQLKTTIILSKDEETTS
jgi:hypothetical protein